MVLFRWIFLCQVNELCSKMNLVLPPSRWFPLPPRCPFWRRPQHDVWRKGSLEDDLRKCNFWRKWSEDLCISDISIIFNHFQSFSIPAVPFYLAFPLENPLKTQLFWLVSLCQLMSASGSENAACLELFLDSLQVSSCADWCLSWKNICMMKWECQCQPRDTSRLLPRLRQFHDV